MLARRPAQGNFLTLPRMTIGFLSLNPLIIRESIIPVSVNPSFPCPPMTKRYTMHIKQMNWPKVKRFRNLAMACDFLPRSFRSHDIKRPDDDDFDDAQDDDTAAERCSSSLPGSSSSSALSKIQLDFHGDFGIKEKREIAIKITPQSTDEAACKMQQGQDFE